MTQLRYFLCTLCILCGSILSAQNDNCGCDSTQTWDQSEEKANVIFLGTCMDVTPNALKGGLNILFQVDSSWKRDIELVTTVHTNSPNQCGYPFLKGKRYIVFANKQHQTEKTSQCEPNQLYDDNGILTLRRLGQGFPPGRPGGGTNLILLMSALGIAGLLFLAFVVLRKKIGKAKPVS